MTADTGELEQVRQRVAQLKREQTAQQQAKTRDRLQRWLGHIMRPVAYLSPVALLAIWLWPDKSVFGPAAESLAVEDWFFISCAILVLFLVGLPIVMLTFNVDHDEIDWEAWGRFGLWPIVLIAGAALLFV